MAMINCFGRLIGWVVAVVEEQWLRLLPSMIVEDNRGGRHKKFMVPMLLWLSCSGGVWRVACGVMRRLLVETVESQESGEVIHGLVVEFVTWHASVWQHDKLSSVPRVVPRVVPTYCGMVTG